MTQSTIVRREKADEAAGLMGKGTPLSSDDLLKLPLFKGISKKLLDDNHGAVVLRHFEKGEVICRQGDYGSTAFFVLSGNCDVFINTPIAGVNTTPQSGFMGLFKKMASALRGGHARTARPTPTHVHIDAPVDLPWGDFRATIGDNSLFGEMTCLNFYPRSATVIAREPVACLEMLRNILDLIYRNEPQAKWRKEKQKFVETNPGKKFDKPRPEDGPIGKTYRERSLRNHLSGFPLFRNVSADFLEHLRASAEIVTFEPGEVIFRQGDPADEFYIVRIGFVKVSQARAGGEMVLQYLSRGQYFGEIALLARAEGKEAKRTATCTAIDHVEAVVINADDFSELISRFPDAQQQLRAEAERRLKTDEDLAKVTQSVGLGDFLDQGLMQAQSLLVLDLDRCTRCDECVRACADSHDGVTRLVRDGLRFDKYLVATSCRSCLDPVCMIGCPVGSIGRSDTREIFIEDWCIGCDLCAQNCPYGNINMHPFEVDTSSKLFQKQSPLRQARVRLDPLPSSLDITLLPEGLSYDDNGGWLNYIGLPNEKNRGKLREYCSDASYQRAIGSLLRQMETRVPLPILPADFKPEKRLSPYIQFDPAQKSLVFLGVITPDDKEEYLNFSSDNQYKQAVEKAAKQSFGRKAVVYKATTCDLCESLKQEPNCVYACPHEAAMRVEPKLFFGAK
ncbi:MAG TPA: cyclic nucleotide-binding domain-containing protein [Tepidisphaeraceae bacterium]|nr:cyclic nucleotide-binding domain-containing protein [Tepidisphaeraceae bacterium]